MWKCSVSCLDFSPSLVQMFSLCLVSFLISLPGSSYLAGNQFVSNNRTQYLFTVETEEDRVRGILTCGEQPYLCGAKTLCEGNPSQRSLPRGHSQQSRCISPSNVCVSKNLTLKAQGNSVLTCKDRAKTWTLSEKGLWMFTLINSSCCLSADRG